MQINKSKLTEERLSAIMQGVETMTFEEYQQILENEIKSSRYDILRDRYLNQNQKHFDELCGEYFEEDNLK